ncbi:transmembrane protein [Rhizoctonia solani]|uniref:Transmembrane protein n=1 Tax=Rhizoctonia solani TaxID=456999 RepID=A0A8H8SXU1_9AGAM|nr:uncharacterized protein RhiXN_06723 [Rhizoctonia solani]QRW21734.1 transmembrane protein [Rhizoctonia solani]
MGPRKPAPSKLGASPPPPPHCSLGCQVNDQPLRARQNAAKSRPQTTSPSFTQSLRQYFISPRRQSEVLDRAPAAQAGSPGLEDLQKLPSTDGKQIPGWLNLFYDLAWTATFSSLTSNNQFREPWDSVSYVVFFIVAWWMWVSQALYNIDFYSNDWFHLLFIFLQLLVFGALAATTRGFDISNYILHSPGSSELHVYDIMTIELESGLLLLQHLRVLIYAKLTSNQGRFPRRLLIIPIGLIISTGLMFGSFSITLNKAGTEPYGAKIKYALWGVAILVEMIAHVIRAQLEINQGIRLRAHGSIASRLCDITTIIIGEGINAISGTFYAILQAPGFGAPTGTGVVCCAFIIFFLVYLYFEGVAPLGNIRRRAAWVMVHLPWLLSVILLLEGVKNQLLLSSFFSTSTHLMTKIMGTLESDMGEGAGIEQVDQIMRPLLLQAGLSWEDEFARLEALYSNSTAVNSTDPNAIDPSFGVWLFRVLLSTTLTSYLTFMDNGTISEETYKVIDSYQYDYNFTLEDLHASLENGTAPHYGKARSA